MSDFRNRANRVRIRAAFCGFLFVSVSHLLVADTLCVNASGNSKCYTTIGAAVAAASAGDQINVASGQYFESVVISKPLSLVGAGPDLTIINAHGQANGIYVDGVDNGGLSNVLVSGFTVLNANYEGILLTNTNNSLIANNHVVNNDQALDVAHGTCPGQPAFETNEGLDCGSGVHFSGTYNVTLANNVIELNSGGILISDETGQTYENLITGNIIRDNVLDCGITLASHGPAPQSGSKAPFGVFSNTVASNTIIGNGTIGGGGAGVGIFAPGPGNLAFSNKVIGNDIENNGHAGVSMHNHAAPAGAPGINMNGNVITGNYISGNGADVGQTATPGTAGIAVFSVAPVYATEIVQNTITNQANGVVMNHPGGMDVHLNNLLTAVGVANIGAGSINAPLNFFGCPSGPGTTGGCASVKGPSVVSAPWMSQPVANAPTAPTPRGAM